MSETSSDTSQRESEGLNNTYVKEYYNTQLKALNKDYMDERWFSSRVAEFDYNQTRNALLHALSGVREGNILEIGPGDGVWTDLILPLKKKLALLDQSEEMIARAQKRLVEHNDITYHTGDFSAFQTDEKFDLIFAVRCFEYFEDKEADVAKMYALLNEGGKLIIVTKNRSYVSRSQRKLHTLQLTKDEMVSLLTEKGFTVEAVYAATLRVKAAYGLSRGIFKLLHKLHVVSNGRFTIPYVFDRVTESYTYVAKKK